MSSVWSIRRSTSDKKLAGVCSGVASHWNVDPILVRVGWVLLAFSGGVGVVLYVAAWLLVPADSATTSVMDDWTKGKTRDWSREVWVVIVTVVSLITFAIFSSTTSIGFGPAVVLALIWYFGYYKSRSKRATPAPPPYGAPPAYGRPTRPDALGKPPVQEPFRYPGPATPFTQAAEAWQQRVEDMRRSAANPGANQPPAAAVPPTEPIGPEGTSWQTYPSYPYHSGPSPIQDPASPEVVEAAARANFLATPDPVGLYTAAVPAKAASAPSRRAAARSLSARRLRLVGLIALGLTLLGLGIADSVGVPITSVIYVSTALLVVGLTLIAATWFGRARGILPVGLVLLMVVLGMLVGQPAGPLLHDFTYTSLGQLTSEPVQVQDGLVNVDLTQVAVTGDTTFHAELGRGAMEIIAPADTNLVLDYRIGNGAVMDNDTTVVTGSNKSGVTTLVQASDDAPILTLDVDLDAGIVSVKR
ncbi:MAG: PspC domain-containing protein [Microlunatus sp.]